MSVVDVSAESDEFTSLVDVREGMGITSGDNIVGALARGSEVVDTTESVFEGHALSRGDRSISLVDES